MRIGGTSLSTAHNETAAQANHELVAAPGAEYRLVITRLLMSNRDAAGTVTFVSDTADAQIQCGPTWNLRAPDNGSIAVCFELPANTNFGFTSSGVAIHSISCEYHVESA